MNSPLTALAWEIWQRGRRSAWFVIGCVSVCALLAQAISGKPRIFESIEPVFWLLLLASFFLVFGIFNYAEFNPAKNWHGFPLPRLFVLPISTWLLVACPMFLGTVSVSLVYFAWTKLVFAPLGKILPLWPCLILAVGILCYQAIVWALAGFRITRMVVLGLAGMVFMDLAVLPAYPELLAGQPWKNLVARLSLLLAALAVAAILAAWFFVERQRHGGGRGRGWLRHLLASLLVSVPRRTRGFSSPAAAQFWFEWRRGGMVLPMCSGALLLLVFGPVSWQSRHHPEGTVWILEWLILLPIVLAAAVGKGFAKPEFWSSDLSLPPFLAVRPLSSGEIVVAKMKAAALSVVITWLLVLTFLACWLPGWANTVELTDLWSTLVALGSRSSACVILLLLLWLAAALTWRGMVGTLWAGLSGNMRKLVLAAVLQVSALLLTVWVCYRLKNSGWKHISRNVSLIGWTLALLAMLKLWLAAYSWNKISPRRIREYSLLWAIGTLGLVALGLLICPDIFWLKHLFILAALLPIPIASLGFASRALEKNRHR